MNVADLMSTVYQELDDTLAQYSTYWKEEVWPFAMEVWYKLDVPSWEVYRPALQFFVEDLWRIGQSASHLAYLTGKPFVILLGMLLHVAWEVGKVVFDVLLEQGWVQLQQGWVQLKVTAIWFVQFQSKLSTTELLGEVAIVGLIVGLFYLCRWIRQQSYWSRCVQWYTKKKERAMEITSQFVYRVSRVSLILAMAIPHFAFVGAYVALKVLFPGIVKWLAHDTHTTAIISLWYPLIMTLSWIHEKRHAKVVEPTNAQSTPRAIQVASSPSTKDSVVSPSGVSPNDKRRTPSYMRTTAAQQSRDRNTVSTRRKTPAPFSRTNPPKPETPGKRQVATPQRTPIKSPLRPKSPGMNLFVNEPEAATRYWLRYWVVYGLMQCIAVFCSLVPVFGSLVAKHPFVLHVCNELRLLFFIWIFCMENSIGAAVPDEGNFMRQAMPLSIIHSYATPLLLNFEFAVAECISRDTWTSMVHSKAKAALDLMVMIKLVSETRKEWLLHFVEEGRTLLLPSLSLFMPSFLTQFGVTYVQFVVPSAKSARTLGAPEQAKMKNNDNEQMELLYLQYWVVHCLVSGAMSYVSGILWWIPFSTHATFLLWCHLSLPKSIRQFYDSLESELVAFGLLPGESTMALHETRTAQVFQAVCSRLPSASDSEIGREADSRSTSHEDEHSTSSSQHLDSKMSVDSQGTNEVEVSIRDTQCNSALHDPADSVMDCPASTDDTKQQQQQQQIATTSTSDDVSEEGSGEWLDISKSFASSSAETLDITSSESSSPAASKPTVLKSVEAPVLRRSTRRTRKVVH